MCVPMNEEPSSTRANCVVVKCFAHSAETYAPPGMPPSERLSCPVKSVASTSQYARVFRSSAARFDSRTESSIDVETYMRGFSLSMYVCEPIMEMVE